MDQSERAPPPRRTRRPRGSATNLSTLASAGLLVTLHWGLTPAACLVSPPAPLDALPPNSAVTCLGDNSLPVLAAPSSENVRIRLGDGIVATRLRTSGTAVSVNGESSVALDRARIATSGDHAFGIAVQGNPALNALARNTQVSLSYSSIEAASPHGSAITANALTSRVLVMNSEVSGDYGISLSNCSWPRVCGGGENRLLIRESTINATRAGLSLSTDRSTIELEGSQIVSTGEGVTILGEKNALTLTGSRIAAEVGISVLPRGAGTGNTVSLSDSTIDVSGREPDKPATAMVLNAGAGAVARLSRSVITASGADATGIFAGGSANSIGLEDSRIVAMGAQAVGIYSEGGDVTLNGGSRIEASGQDAHGLIFNGAPERQNAIVNRGVISSDQGIAVWGENATFTNSGVLKGGSGTAIRLGGYNNRLILQSGSIIEGAIQGDGAGNHMRLQGMGELASAVDGFETLTLEGPGTWVLSGDGGFSGGTRIDGGVLRVDGMLESQVTINPGGVLSGQGTVGSINANPGGMVSPGVSSAPPTGTLSVKGDVTLSPGSLLQVGIDPAGRSSHLTANGTARITDARVLVLPVPGNYQLNTRYPILSAAGGVAGTFGEVTSSSSALLFTLIYAPNDIFLALRGIDFVSTARNPNQTAVGSYLDRVALDPGMQALIGQLLAAPSAQTPAALASLDGELHASLASAMLSQGSEALRRLGGRLSRLEEGLGGLPPDPSAPVIAATDSTPYGGLGSAARASARPGFWVQGLGDNSRVSSDGNASGYRYSSAGVALGLDAQTAPGGFAGASFSYLDCTLHLSARDDRAVVTSPQLSFYASHRSGSLILKGVVGYAWNRYETRRVVGIPAAPKTGRATYNGRAASAYVEAAYALPPLDGALEPVAALQWVGLDQDPFNEQGAGAASLLVADQNPSSLKSYLGSRFHRAIGRTARLELRALWAHEFSGRSAAIDAAMAGATTAGTFETVSAAPSRDAAVVGAGLVARHDERLAFYLDYDATLHDGQTTQALVGGLRYVW